MSATEMERDVLRLRDEGLTFKAIGERLGISGSRASQYAIRAQGRRDLTPFYSGSSEADIRAIVPESVAREFVSHRLFHWREVVAAYANEQDFQKWPSRYNSGRAADKLVRFVLRTEVNLPKVAVDD